MKLKNKAIIALLIVMFSVMIQQNVNAVGTVYQAIYEYSNQKRLIYRTIAKPHKSTLNLFGRYGYWIQQVDWKTSWR